MVAVCAAALLPPGGVQNCTFRRWLCVLSDVAAQTQHEHTQPHTSSYEMGALRTHNIMHLGCQLRPKQYIERGASVYISFFHAHPLYFPGRAFRLSNIPLLALLCACGPIYRRFPAPAIWSSTRRFWWWTRSPASSCRSARSASTRRPPSIRPRCVCSCSIASTTTARTWPKSTCLIHLITLALDTVQQFANGTFSCESSNKKSWSAHFVCSFYVHTQFITQ